MTQIVFESFNMPTVYVAIQAMPSMLVSDRATCPVTDSPSLERLGYRTAVCPARSAQSMRDES